VSTVAAAGLSYAFQLLVGRLMSKPLYAETQALLSLYMVCSVPLTPVFLLVTRRVIDLQQAGDGHDVRALVDGLMRRTTLLGLLFTAVLTVLRTPIAEWLRITDTAAVPVFAASVGLNALYLVPIAVLLGRHNWLMANLLPVACGALRLMLSLLFAGDGSAVVRALSAIALSAAACLLIGYAFAVRGLADGGRYRALHLGEVGLATILNAAFWILVQADTVYVNRELPLIVDGGYAAASALGKMLVYIPVAVGTVMFPLLAAARSARQRRAVLLRMLAMAAILAGLGLLLIALFSERILGLTLGSAYADTAGLLRHVAAVLAPFALVSVFLYDALARHDRATTAVFAATATVAAAVLALAPPSLQLLFTVLLAGAVTMLSAGAYRAVQARRHETIA
jgi:O-antigen/teichoic acid export membrane protein